MLSAPEDRRTIDLRDYKTEVCQRFTEAWKLAQCQIQKAQKAQKQYYDCGTTPTKVHVGDRVFVYTPSEKTGKAYKFACPFIGPYKVLELYDNGVKLMRISKPNSQPIRVALNPVRLCPAEVRDAPTEGSELLEQVTANSHMKDTHTPVPEGEVIDQTEVVDKTEVIDQVEVEIKESPAPVITGASIFGTSDTPENSKEGVGTIQKVDGSQSSTTYAYGKDPKGMNTWSRRLRPRRKKKNTDQ